MIDQYCASIKQVLTTPIDLDIYLKWSPLAAETLIQCEREHIQDEVKQEKNYHST